MPDRTRTPFLNWLESRLPVVSFVERELIDYPTPNNLNMWWNFGSLAGITLIVMILTGIWLAMHYVPHVDHAFESVERIMRDMNYGWLLRYVHMNGASMFFIVIYIHMFRGLYFGSYKPPREVLWGLGVVIFLLLMATAFFGYTLPWGQMSFWGAVVITNLISAIPAVGFIGAMTAIALLAYHWSPQYLTRCGIKKKYMKWARLFVTFPFALSLVAVIFPLGFLTDIVKFVFYPIFFMCEWIGDSITQLLWGGYSVNNATLNRFFVFHFLLPFAIVGVSMLHLVALHKNGSNNPTGHDLPQAQKVPFHPYYTIKDLFGLMVFFTVWAGFVFFAPDFFGEPDNYIQADPLVTPPHIVPEWYFLPFYALLRAVPDKVGGVFLMFSAVLILFFLPKLDFSPIRSARERPLYRMSFWFFVVSCLVLGWAGKQAPEGTPLLLARIAGTYYFAFFLVLMPLISRLEIRALNGFRRAK